MKKFNEKLYDKIYNRIEKIIKKYNPCRIQDGKCIRGEFCCSECQYNCNGCLAYKPLWCKLWFCDEAIENIPKKVLVKISKLTDLAFKNKLLLYRQSKEEVKKCSL